MSRRLDALFAERVLGCKPKWFNDPFGEDVECGCAGQKHNHPVDGPACLYLESYTRSLDSAWRGVEKQGRVDQIDFSPPGECWHVTLDWWDDDTRQKGFSYDTTGKTPAEALVKALLLAVGVTQEQIEEAEK